jgi:hypothetical protein
MIRYRPRESTVEVIIDSGLGPNVEVWGVYRTYAHARAAVRHLRRNGFPAFIMPRPINLRRLWDALDLVDR